MKTYGNVGVGNTYGAREIPLPHAEGRLQPHRPWCVDCKRKHDAEQLNDDGKCDRCATAAASRAEAAQRRAERLAAEQEARKAQEAEETARRASSATTADESTPRKRATRPATPRAERQPRRTPQPRARAPRAERTPPGPRPLLGMQTLIQEYRDGATVPNLAARYGTTAARVRRLLDHHGIERRDDRSTHSGGRNRIEHPPELVDQVRRLYHESDLSRTQVGERLGLTLKQVELIMNRHGITARQRQAGRIDGAKGLKQQIRDLGVTTAQIKAWAAEHGLLEDAHKVGLPSQRLVDAYAREHA